MLLMKLLVEPSPELNQAVADSLRYKDSILFCTFTTVDEYLRDLEVICKQLSCLGPKALIYLAAAVSDFYVHEEKLVRSHENFDITSRCSANAQDAIEWRWRSTESECSQEDAWSPCRIDCPEGACRLIQGRFLIKILLSFAIQLETDPEILIPKAERALRRYGHNLVIGNVLVTRKTKVVFVKQDNVENLELNDEQVSKGIEIERLIVEKLRDTHDTFISSSTTSK